MPFIKDMEKCGFLGCNRPQMEDHTYTFGIVNGGEKTIRICLYHESMVGDPNIECSVGITLRGEAEIRPTTHPPSVIS